MLIIHFLSFCLYTLKMEPFFTFLTLNVLKIRVNWHLTNTISWPWGRFRNESECITINFGPREIKVSSWPSKFNILLICEYIASTFDCLHVRKFTSSCCKNFPNRKMIHVLWIVLAGWQIVLLKEWFYFQEGNFLIIIRDLNDLSNFGNHWTLLAQVIQMDKLSRFVNLLLILYFGV